MLVKRQTVLGTYILVVGVEHSRDSLSTLLVRNGALVLSRVELLEVKFAARSLATPETEVVASTSLVSGN
jgi:hypothetical protein